MKQMIWLMNGVKVVLLSCLMASALAVAPALAHGGEDHSRKAPVEETKAPAELMEMSPQLEMPQSSASPLTESPSPATEQSAESLPPFFNSLGELIFGSMLALPLGLLLLRNKAQSLGL